jgi:hypothetical protein
MTIAHCIAMVAPFVLICAGGATGKTKDVIQSETASPKLVMLVNQRFPFDKATESGMALPMLMRTIAVELTPCGIRVKAPTASLPPPSFRLPRVERTSSRAGVPAEVQRLSRRTVTPTTA